MGGKRLQPKPEVAAFPDERLGENGPQFTMWMFRRDVEGPPPKYETPEELAHWCQKYFDYTSQLPPLPGDKPVPFTLQGMLVHIGVSMKAWREWRNGNRPDLIPVIDEAEKIIQDQQLRGAVGGMYNGNLVARLNGITDKREIEQKTIEAIEVKFIDPPERQQMIDVTPEESDDTD